MKPPKHKRRLLAFWVLAASILAALTATADAACSIDVGTHRLAPNRVGQDVKIWVTGGEQVEGLNFFAQIGDGGLDGPAFADVDIKTGTIFNGVPTIQLGGIIAPRVIDCWIITEESGVTVTASGLLATLTIDTTGFNSGTWDLLLSGVLGQYDTDFADDWIDITNGSITFAHLGDCNLDGQVNESDAAIIAANWLRDDDVGWAEGDFSGDGKVDSTDATIMAANWQYSSAAATVPEPAAIVMLSICILIGVACRTVCGRGKTVGS